MLAILPVAGVGFVLPRVVLVPRHSVPLNVVGLRWKYKDNVGRHYEIN
jgi:hypothetical protein